MKREFSAGGVVVRGSGERAEVVIVSPRKGVYALPKGHADGGETMEEAATREVLEEAGVVAEPLGKLGEVRYWYTLAGERVLKAVTFFLFRYRSGSVEDHDDEVESAQWVPLEDAAGRLSFRGDREMVAKAIERRRRDGTG